MASSGFLLSGCGIGHMLVQVPEAQLTIRVAGPAVELDFVCAGFHPAVSFSDFVGQSLGIDIPRSKRTRLIAGATPR